MHDATIEQLTARERAEAWLAAGKRHAERGEDLRALGCFQVAKREARHSDMDAMEFVCWMGTCSEAIQPPLRRLVGTLPEAPAVPDEDDDTCGLCGEPGADKIPHPHYWPGERRPDTDLVHAACEHEEQARAHAALTQEQREAVLRSIR